MIMSRDKLYRLSMLMVSIVLLFSLLLPLMTERAYAASSRAAVVEEVEGTAYLKKAGGSNPYRLFKRMTVNDGDMISTEAKSSVTLRMADREDEITIGENSEVYIADLLASDGSATEMKVRTGSIYSKVSGLGKSDEFKISTPNATMGVRGTHFLVVFDFQTGKTWVQVYSGLVQSGQLGGTNNSNNSESDEPEGGSIFIYPTMQGTFMDMVDESNQEIHTVSFMVPLDAPEVDTAILKKILRNQEEIKQENDEYFNQSGEGSAPLPVDDEDLERFKHNVEILISVLLNQGIQNGQLTEKEIRDIIEQLPGEIEWIQDAQLELSEEEQQRLEQLLETERRRERQRQELERKMQDMKEERQELLDRISQQRNFQEQQNQEASEERRNQAVNRYLDQLTPEERERFLEQREEQTGSETQDPAATPNESSRERNNRNDGSTTNPEPEEPDDPQQPEVQPSVELRSASNGDEGMVVLEVVLKDFPETLYGAEMHILFNANHFHVGSIESNVDDIFAHAADHIKQETGYYIWKDHEEEIDTTEIVYAVLSVGDVTNNPVSESGAVLLRIPLTYAADHSATGSVIIKGLKFVDREGNELPYDIDEPSWQYEY